MARPTSYDPSYCEKVIELGAQGYSVVEMAAEIGVHRETLEENWPAAHEEFSEAFMRARELSQAWWESQGRKHLTTAGFQSALYSRSMAARFPRDWRETTRSEQTGKDGGPIETVTKIERTIIDPQDSHTT